MKQELNSGSTLDLIAYRLQRAKETLVEADYNAKGEYYNAAQLTDYTMPVITQPLPSC